MNIEKQEDIFKPWFHIYPEKGWLNDPCGCSLFQDKYHVFYQYHEQPCPQGPGKWYHRVSRDLVHWQDQGIVLEPEEPYEIDGCWTGSSLELEGKQYLYYSSNRDGRIPQQQPAMAVSSNGRNYARVWKKPLIDEATPDGHREMRDPKVFCRDGVYYMLQGASRHGRGEIVGYCSEDGFHWKYRGIFYSSEKWIGSMLECPDFFTLDGVDCLLFSPMDWNGHSNVLLTGKADFNTFRFTGEKIFDLDQGSDFYAAQTFPHKDGGVVLIGWMGAWGKPHPECENGWGGMLTLPRKLHYDRAAGRLTQTPVRELEALRTRRYSEVLSVGKSPVSPAGNMGNHMEAEIIIPEISKGKDRISISLGTADEAAITFSIDMGRGIMQIDKTGAAQGDNSFRTVLLPEYGGADDRKLRLFWDGSACELFWGNGRMAVSERIYPVKGEPVLSFGAAESERKVKVCVWQMDHIF